jgi:hypothetical protein
MDDTRIDAPWTSIASSANCSLVRASHEDVAEDCLCIVLLQDEEPAGELDSCQSGVIMIS